MFSRSIKLRVTHAVSKSWTPFKSLSTGPSTQSFIEYERDVENRVGIIKLNDPKRLNPLTAAMGDEFKAVIEEIKSDSRIRAVVLTGAGRAFSAGGDLEFLKARMDDSPINNSFEMREFYDRFLSLRTLPVPVISAINGHAVGAGFCISLLTDIRIASNKAKMGFNFVKLGLHPGMAVTHFLPNLCGSQVANRLLLTGEMITGEEAFRVGIVSKAVDEDKVLLEALSTAHNIARSSPVAVKSLVKTLRNNQNEGLEKDLWREADAQAHCYASEDFREGLTAISEKREPNFTD